MKGKTALNCDSCQEAHCCRTPIAQQVRRPRTAVEVDAMLWYLQFPNIEYMIYKRKWYQLFRDQCMHLDKHNRCAIYKDRPHACRRYDITYCRHHSPRSYTMLKTRDELLGYLQPDKIIPDSGAYVRERLKRARGKASG